LHKTDAFSEVPFYAGVPLRVGCGHALGTLCLLDTVPRGITPTERERHSLLARTVVDLIEMRLDRFRANEEHARALRERQLLKLTVENVREGIALVNGDFQLILWNKAFLDLFDYDESQVLEGADVVSLMRLTAALGELGPGDPR
jgi:PAS domain-containing protein